MHDFKKITKNWNNWLLSEQQTKKPEITAGSTHCRSYSNLKDAGLPEDLHPFQVSAAVMVPSEGGEKEAVGWLTTAFTKKGEKIAYAASAVSGAAKQKVLQKGGKAIIFKDGATTGIGGDIQALAELLAQLKIDAGDDGKYTVKWTGDDKWQGFTVDIASGKQKVDYCKGAPTQPAEKTNIEKDDICNDNLVLKVQKSYSKRLPGVQMKNASPKIVISVCKIQRVLNGILGTAFPTSEIDGVIGPKTMKALQKAYHLMKPAKAKALKESIKSIREMEMAEEDDWDCDDWKKHGYKSKKACCKANKDADTGDSCKTKGKTQKRTRKKR